MTDEKLRKLIDLLRKEYHQYEILKELFEEKKELLKRAKSGDLVQVDDKIVATNLTIKKYDERRNSLSVELIGKNGCMSDFIEYSELHETGFSEELKEIKTDINNIVEELILLNNQNIELTKHGIVMTNKMLETIVSAFAPQGSIYNTNGKITDTKDLNMWTVNEEV